MGLSAESETPSSQATGGAERVHVHTYTQSHICTHTHRNRQTLKLYTLSHRYTHMQRHTHVNRQTSGCIHSHTDTHTQTPAQGFQSGSPDRQAVERDLSQGISVWDQGG